MRAVIFAGGSLGNPAAAKCLIPPDALIICADSGFDHAIALGLTPDLVVGDMDSVRGDYTIAAAKVFPAKKDYTDTELAIAAALERGCDQMLLLAATGTRLDHTLANLLLLLPLAERGVTAVLADGQNEVHVVHKRLVLHARPGQLLSLIALSDCIGVTTKGLAYPLRDETLPFGVARGVSNVFEEDTVEIMLQSGRLFAILSHD